MTMTALDHQDLGRVDVLRQALLRPASADIYPTIPAGQWLPAAVVAARLLEATHGGGGRSIYDRILPNEHFEFRGGRLETMLRRRARTRWADHPSAPIR